MCEPNVALIFVLEVAAKVANKETVIFALGYAIHEPDFNGWRSDGITAGRLSQKLCKGPCEAYDHQLLLSEESFGKSNFDLSIRGTISVSVSPPKDSEVALFRDKVQLKEVSRPS